MKRKSNDMKPFFSDKEVRKFTFKEKIIYIFDQLHALLQPKEFVHRETMYDYTNSKKKTIKRITSIINEKGIAFIDKIELPFGDITVKADQRGYIEITGDTFCYTFPSIMMPEIWYRLKRML